MRTNVRSSVRNETQSARQNAEKMASIVALSEQSKLLSDREPNARMDFSGSRAEVEKLLKWFLIGTQNVTLDNQILDIDKIPEPCRARVRAAEAQGTAVQ